MSSAFFKHITIHFADKTSQVTPVQLAKDCGLPVREVDDAIDRLVELGYLVPRPDGTFDAAIPEAVGR